MSNSMAAKFVTQFKELGFDGNSKARTAMLKSLDFQYGDLSDKALTQLMTAGLPKGTKVGLVLGTEQTINEFMSFDDPKEVLALTNFLARQDDTDISLEKIKTAIVNQSDYGDIYNINRQNVPFDISGTITEMDEITDVLSLYAAKLMFGNPGMSVDAASKEASLLFSNNYRVEDTYFLPRKIDGRDINDRELDTHVKILDTIKYNYLPTFEAVAFKSNREDVSSKELTEKMNYNLINNGEWRNSADGEGSVYGIVLSNNSFGIVVNENGEELFVKHGDNSYTLPGGSGIEIDINLPTEQEKKQYRGYYGYAEKIKQESNNLDSDGNFIGGKRENLDNNEMQNALEQSGASTVEISNVFSTAAEASEIDLSQKYNKLPNLEPVKQEWLLTTAKKVFDINKDEIIPSDIILAINSGETGYGTSRFFKEGSNNLFNIQTFNKNTPHIKAKDSDQMIKKYNTVEDSIIDFLSMVKTSKKYKKVREQIKLFNEGKGSKDKIIDAIAATGFAEDEKWSSKTKSILKKRINGKHKNELSNLK